MSAIDTIGQIKRTSAHGGEFTILDSNRSLLLLLKAFRKEEWAEKFLDGVLYCNTVKFYRALEGDKRDKDEGAVVISGDQLKELKIGDYVVKRLDLVTLRHYFNLTSGVNVFCMFGWAPRQRGDEILLNKEEQLGSLREFDRKYGPYSVIIGRPDQGPADRGLHRD